MPARQREDHRARILLAQESARIMLDEGVKDFLAAKRKAASRLGVGNKALWPANWEIEGALLEHQRLFGGADGARRLAALRRAACEAMAFFERFSPRLVGPVLAGTAGRHTPVSLHLFADASEDVLLFLMEHGIPFDTVERRLNGGNGEVDVVPAYAFAAGDVNVELTVFPLRARGQPPLSPVDGKPMRRAGLATVRALLDEEGPPGDP